MSAWLGIRTAIQALEEENVSPLKLTIELSAEDFDSLAAECFGCDGRLQCDGHEVTMYFHSREVTLRRSKT